MPPVVPSCLPRPGSSHSTPTHTCVRNCVSVQAPCATAGREIGVPCSGLGPRPDRCSGRWPWSHRCSHGRRARICLPSGVAAGGAALDQGWTIIAALCLRDNTNGTLCERASVEDTTFKKHPLRLRWDTSQRLDPS